MIGPFKLFYFIFFKNEKLNLCLDYQVHFRIQLLHFDCLLNYRRILFEPCYFYVFCVSLIFLKVSERAAHRHRMHCVSLNFIIIQQILYKLYT